MIRTPSMRFRHLLLALIALFALAQPVWAQRVDSARTASERDFYRIVTLPIPAHVDLEVGGMAFRPDGSLAIATRKGDVWIVRNPYMLDGSMPVYSRFAQGLHEPLGLAYHDGALYSNQRGELTRLVDLDGDDVADRYDAIVTWPLEGNYHEYSYGPLFREDGSMLVTLNLGWIGRGASLSKWRGWLLEVSPEGEVTPIATGLRSPAGFVMNADGDVFYSENQGDWVGSGRVTHLEPGDFAGNPAGLRWTGEPGSPLTLRPEDVPDTGEPMHVVAERLPELKLPAVWFPHTLMGISTSGMVLDQTGGAFGPFEGQLFVGDQGHSKIMRMYLEKVEGEWQGAVFPFREGFASGVLRLEWGRDGSLFVGQTSRGWAATGTEPYALQRVVWSGETPFEIKTIEARPDGFELTFTEPIDPASAADVASYRVTGFTYQYHSTYGSDVIDRADAPVRAAVPAPDGLGVRLVIDELRAGYIHEVRASGLRSADGNPLLHDLGYYTLNQIPTGERLSVTAQPRSRSDRDRTEQRPESERSRRDDPAPKRMTEMPASWGGRADVSVTVGTEPGLQFDLGEFSVPARGRVELVFNNDDDMLHNLVIVRPGTADAVATEAMQLGLDGPEMNYVPDNPAVLHHTALLQPQSTERIYFTAPAESGAYPFVCTFPGHAFTMRGVMRVE